MGVEGKGKRMRNLKGASKNKIEEHPALTVACVNSQTFLAF